MEPIAHIESPFGSKFGVPRQSGITNDIISYVVFEPQYRNAEALRGIEEFEYIWLLWQFHGVSGWSPTVRPPRLGGNRRMGVFATRSPYRPNHIGLSSVRLLRVEECPDKGHCLVVGGADLMDGTPILDIKPYLPYTDAHPEARSGFATCAPQAKLNVEIAPSVAASLPPTLLTQLREILALDPRPQYQDDPTRIYGITLWGYDFKFKVVGNVLSVISSSDEAR